jgi:hypothetical protein
MIDLVDINLGSMNVVNSIGSLFHRWNVANLVLKHESLGWHHRVLRHEDRASMGLSHRESLVVTPSSIHMCLLHPITVLLQFFGDTWVETFESAQYILVAKWQFPTYLLPRAS